VGNEAQTTLGVESVENAVSKPPSQINSHESTVPTQSTSSSKLQDGSAASSGGGIGDDGVKYMDEDTVGSLAPTDTSAADRARSALQRRSSPVHRWHAKEEDASWKLRPKDLMASGSDKSSYRQLAATREQLGGATPPASKHSLGGATPPAAKHRAKEPSAATREQLGAATPPASKHRAKEPSGAEVEGIFSDEALPNLDNRPKGNERSDSAKSDDPSDIAKGGGSGDAESGGSSHTLKAMLRRLNVDAENNLLARGARANAGILNAAEGDEDAESEGKECKKKKSERSRRRWDNDATVTDELAARILNTSSESHASSQRMQGQAATSAPEATLSDSADTATQIVTYVPAPETLPEPSQAEMVVRCEQAPPPSTAKRAVNLERARSPIRTVSPRWNQQDLEAERADAVARAKELLQEKKRGEGISESTTGFKKADNGRGQSFAGASRS